MKILQQTAWLCRCGGRRRCKETQLFMDSQLCTQTGVYCKCVFLLVHESLARVCVCAKMSSYQCRAAWDWMPKTSLERCTPPPRTIGCLDWLHWNGAGPEPHGSETSEGWKDNMFFLSILDICQILVLRAALSQTTAGSISKNCLQIFNPQILWHLLPAIICSTIAKNRKKSKQVHCHEINLLVLQHCNMTWC